MVVCLDGGKRLEAVTELIDDLFDLGDDEDKVPSSPALEEEDDDVATLAALEAMVAKEEALARAYSLQTGASQGETDRREERSGSEAKPPAGAVALDEEMDTHEVADMKKLTVVKRRGRRKRATAQQVFKTVEDADVGEEEV